MRLLIQVTPSQTTSPKRFPKQNNWKCRKEFSQVRCPLCHETINIKALNMDSVNTINMVLFYCIIINIS